MEKPEKSYWQAAWEFDQYTQKELEEIKERWNAYINEKYSIGYSEENTCVIYRTSKDEECFTDFGIFKPVAYMWGRKPENIRNCKITIIEDNISLAAKYRSGYDENCTDYFGWISYGDDDDKPNRIALIQPNIKMFSIQFAGAGDYEAEHGAGKIVRLKVELLDDEESTKDNSEILS